MTIRDVFKKETITIRENASVNEAAKLFIEKNIGFLIIIGEQGESPVGVLTDRDIVRNIIDRKENLENIKVKEIMSKDLLTLDPKQGIKEIIKTMNDRCVRRAPVIENNRIIGIVSIDELIILLADELNDVADLIRKQIVRS